MTDRERERERKRQIERQIERERETEREREREVIPHLYRCAAASVVSCSDRHKQKQ